MDALFGKDRAGALLVADVRLLLLPVRSLTGAYRWATCPHLIERYQRDLRRAGLAPLPADVPAFTTSPTEPGGLAAEAGGVLYLEEREIHIRDGLPERLVEAIAPLVRHDATRARLARQLVVLADEDFAWFCRYGLPIQARNKLDDETKTSTNLWHEESLPTDTLMYALVMTRAGAATDSLGELFPENDAYLHVGGNETVGQGWFALTHRSGGQP